MRALEGSHVHCSTPSLCSCVSLLSHRPSGVSIPSYPGYGVLEYSMVCGYPLCSVRAYRASRSLPLAGTWDTYCVLRSIMLSSVLVGSSWVQTMRYPEPSYRDTPDPGSEHLWYPGSHTEFLDVIICGEVKSCTPRDLVGPESHSTTAPSSPLSLCSGVAELLVMDMAHGQSEASCG